MRITCISGTNRHGSRTLQLTKIAQHIFSDCGAETTLLDLQALPPGLFTPESYANKPDAFQPFVDQVLNSDGLYVVAPEYNGSFPGVLKLFIDMLPFPESFEGRNVAFTGLAAGRFGNLRGIEQLQGIFGYRNARIFPQRLFIAAAHKVLQDGELQDEELMGRLTKQIEAYCALVRHNLAAE
jgi:chromate reductase, NAD(P)H dehydrogenase (quinone)